MTAAEIRENADMLDAVTKAAIAATYEKIRPHIRRTPVLELDGRELDLGSCRVVLKLEQLQHMGAFKTRGAFANLLMRDVPDVGVAAASGGNHGAAVSYAAAKLDVMARIFVPEIASPTKIARIRENGADLAVAGDRYADALAASERWIEQSGALSVHAYDQVETMLGQGTIGLELSEQAPGIDTLLVAVGGGGLIGGLAGWCRGAPKLVGVEPEASPTLCAAFEAGRPVDAATGGLAADSLAPHRVGSLTYPMARAFVDRIALVTDEDIAAAQERLWQVARVVAEPGGAAALAALLSGAYRPACGETVCVLVCGANTGAVAFGR